MQEQLQTLRELQELDNTINAARQERKVLTEEQEVMLAEQERVKAMVDQLQGQIDELQAQRGDLTHSLTREDDNILRAEARLPEIKTQKEYVAVLKEVDTAKKVRKDLKEQIAAKDAEIGALTEEQTEKDGELTALTEKVAEREGEIKEKLDSHDAVMAEKEGNRNELLGKLPKSVQNRYQTLLERRAGLAVVEARAGACLGCNMHLPPQLYNSLFKMQAIEACPLCNRLIYVAPEV